VFGLDQGDAALAGDGDVAVAFEARGGGQRLVDLGHRHVAARAQADPAQGAGARQRAHQYAEFGVGRRQQRSGHVGRDASMRA
jgi:hypothetical protein